MTQVWFKTVSSDRLPGGVPVVAVCSGVNTTVLVADDLTTSQLCDALTPVVARMIERRERLERCEAC